MDSLSLALVILVLFLPLLAFFATVERDPRAAQTPAEAHAEETIHTDCIRLQRPRTRSASQDLPAVLRQNIAVARLMRMEGVL
jgi:hypothetical protein